MKTQSIGKSVPQIGALDKVTGRAKFTDDLHIHNPLYVKFGRSPHAAARINSIDTQAAEALEGVKAIVCGDAFKHTFGVLPISRDEPALAEGRVRYVGEAVFAVAAESEALAERACKDVRVDYTVTKPCLKAEDALQKTDDRIHPELNKENNLHKSVDQNFGDVSGALESADLIVEGKFSFPSISHGFTEPHATQVEIDGQQNITLYSATQVPHYLHRAVSDVLEVPMHKIRVIKPYLGGGFGGKSDPFGHEMVAVKLALITGRNIRLALDRDEVFYIHHGRHPSQITMKLGVHRDHGITALEGKMLIDGGAYGSFGVVTSYYNGVLLQGPYKIPNFHFHCDRVYTNKPMCGAMRGHGGVNPRFATEVLIDMACAKLEYDPCTFRLQNFLDQHSLTANEFRVTSAGGKRCLEQAMAACNWSQKHKRLPYGKGIGVACGFFISGSALPIHWNKMPQSTVRLTLDYHGGITLYSGASDIGQGSDTMMAQMAAEVLGLPMDFIKVVSADTQLCPIDLGSYSSRVTFMAGNAARNAAIRMRRQLLQTACEMWEIACPKAETPNDDHGHLAPDNPEYFSQGHKAPRYDSDYLGANPDYTDGFSFFESKIIAPDGRQLAYLDVLRKALDHRGALQSRGVYHAPKMGGTFKGAGAGLSPAYSFTVMIAEVTVDDETGFIKVDHVTCAHDCGRAINPMAVEGQLEGSIHMGLGQALCEGIVYENGSTQNASFLDYKMLSPFEMPDVTIVIPDCADIEGPFGAKEVGEGALAPVLPAVANAVYDAVGIRMNDLPMTPDKVRRLLQRSKQTQK